MVGSVMQKVFVRFWVLMILNLEFWLFSLIGLFVLGVGPAFRTIMETFLDHSFEYRKYSLKESWNIYKKCFWKANLHFYVFFAVLLFLFYDIYLTSQIRAIWALPIVMLIIFVALFVFLTGLFTLHIESYFDVSFLNAIKLSIAEFFIDFKGLWRFALGAVLILIMTRLFPGLLLFLTFSSLIVWCHMTTRKWVGDVEKQVQ